MLAEFQEQAKKVIDHLQSQLQQVRTGRAQPSLVENVLVEVESYGGARMPLRELASITAADSSLLVIQPFNVQTVKDIEKALSGNDMGLSVVSKGETLQIPIPPLTQERRQQLVKTVKEKIEEARVSIRNLRTDVKQMIEDTAGDAGVSEDDIKRQIEDLQKQVDTMIKKAEDLGNSKEEELLKL